MTKQEIFDNHINTRYEGIEKIIADDKYTGEDVVNYIHFQDSSTRLCKGYQNWLAFMGIADKIKRVGVNGVLMREDVIGTSTGVEDFGDGHFVKYIVVTTNYGDIWVADGRKVVYMR